MNMTLKKVLDKAKKYLVTVIMLAALAAAISLFIMAMTFDGTAVALRGISVFSVWSIIYLLLIMQYVYLLNIKQNDRTTIFVEYTILFIASVLCIVCLKLFNIYTIPFTLAALLTVTLLNKRIAIINNLILAGIVIVSYLSNPIYAQSASEIVIIIVRMCGGLLVVFAIKSEYNRIQIIGISSLIGAGVAVFSMLAALLNYRAFIDLIIIWAWVIASEAAGILIVLCLSPILEWVFRLNTNFRLFEYISFDQPLLKEMNARAPGTFNHSLSVSYLAERCAYAIGENVNLAKAAAYYHDVGKMQNPEYFVENQMDGYNPHDDLIFEASVNMITRHTEIGYQMLLSRGFPKEIANVAREHHGDSPLNYFYIKAQNITEGDLDSGDYRYNGPRPSSKISAIIMIVDAVEAATRAMGAHTKEKIIQIIESIINDKLKYKQFDECDITLKNLAEIKSVLATALEGQYHTRIMYPEKKES
ncbi:MAG: HDIG domain-containing protein [Clostridia bacterium]|nr:HDIG domain-containing protein [Clostridia bacterium]